MEIALILNIRIWSCYYIRIGAKSTNPLRHSGAISDFIDKYLPEYDRELNEKIKIMHINSKKYTKRVLCLNYLALFYCFASRVTLITFDLL